MKYGLVHFALEILRNDPATNIKTLELVRDIMAQHSGKRAVIYPWAARQHRIEIARDIIEKVKECRSGDVRRLIESQCGVSTSTAWRYLKQLGFYK